MSGMGIQLPISIVISRAMNHRAWRQQVLEAVLEVQRRRDVRWIGRHRVDNTPEQLGLAVGEQPASAAVRN